MYRKAFRFDIDILPFILHHLRHVFWNLSAKGIPDTNGKELSFPFKRMRASGGKTRSLKESKEVEEERNKKNGEISERIQRRFSHHALTI
jgi:hypothetical protein